MYQTRIIVSLVQVLEYGGEDFWLLLRETDPFAVRLKELFTAACSEVRGNAEDILVCSKEALIWSNTDSNDGGGSQIANDVNQSQRQVTG